MKQPTPTTHGAWRVIDGQLVDENELINRAADKRESVMDLVDQVADGTPATEALQSAAQATHSRKASKSKE